MLTLSCKSGEPSANNLLDIDAAAPLSLNMSDYFEDIEYIPLETAEDCFVGRIRSLQIMDEFIVVISSGDCLVFDRKTGKFIRRIGTKGNGPNEYYSFIQGDGVNGKKNTIIAAKATGLIEYSLIDGSVVEPPITASIQLPFAGKYMNIDNDSWVKGSLNIAGDLETQLVFFDREKVTDSVANTSVFENKKNSFFMNPSEILFYRYNNNVLYKFLYNDTIFNISNKKLVPQWILKTQYPMSAVADFRGDPQKLNEKSPNHHFVTNIHETDNYLLFNSSYQKKILPFLFSKKKNQLVKVENDGFVNDMDGGLTFWPTYTTPGQELAVVYEAHKLLEEIAEQETGAEKPKSKELTKLLSLINDQANPVVVIATRKKN